MVQFYIFFIFYEIILQQFLSIALLSLLSLSITYSLSLSSLMSSVVCLDKKLFSFCCPGGWVRVSVGWWVSGGEKLGRYINLAIPAREISVST